MIFHHFSVSDMISFSNIIKEFLCWTWNCAVYLSLLGRTCFWTPENVVQLSAVSCQGHPQGTSAAESRCSKYLTLPRVDWWRQRHKGPYILAQHKIKLIDILDPQHLRGQLRLSWNMLCSLTVPPAQSFFTVRSQVLLPSKPHAH